MPSERLVLRSPEAGHKILIAESGLRVPDDPIIPLIEGDGIGPDVVRAARSAIDAAVASAFGGRRRIAWYPVPAGERAMFQYGDMLPEATLGAIREYVVGLKGPLTTPVSGGFRSLNVALRKTLDLYANVRPVYWIPGVPSPVTHPERLDIVIFREGTEDVVKSHGGKIPDGKIVIKDVIADNMFQQLLLRPEEYDVLATTNLNGDYLSDAAAAQIGGLGVAAGGNIGDALALFEPVHGSAPKYAGMDKVNPTAEILAGVMMLEYLGWREAAIRLRSAVKTVVGSKVVTYDLARFMPGAKEVRTSAFARAIIGAMDGAGR